MDVFISWAGKRSGAAAEALKDWIPMVINAAKPWLSKAHIPTGRLWRAELAESLSSCKFGIFCLTPTSIQSHWLFFEAGAISKTLADAYVCPLLIDLKVSDVVSPFGDFQCRLANKDGIFALMGTMNSALPEVTQIPELQLRTALDLLWPTLESKIESLPADEARPQKERAVADVLEEILSRVRAIERGASENVGRELQPDIPPRNERLRQAMRELFPSLDFETRQEGGRRGDVNVLAIDDTSGNVVGETSVPLRMPLAIMIEVLKKWLSGQGIEPPSHPAANNDVPGIPDE